MQRGRSILFALCGGFVVGAFVGCVTPAGVAVLAWAGMLALAVVAVQWKTRQKGVALLAFVGVFAGMAGALRADTARLVGDPYLDAHIGQEVTLEGAVYQEPDVREGSVRLSVAVDRVASSSDVRGGVIAVLPAYADVSYGDRVEVRGALALPEAFDTSGGRQFDYPDYLAVSGIGYQLERAQVRVLEPAEPSFTGYAIALKQWYVRGLDAALVEPQAGLAAGITAGDKRGLGKEVSDEFRTVSLTHIIVLSGYNITVVADALMRVLGFAPLYLRLGAGGFVALFFAVMTGNAAASVRAAAMALIAMSARVSGRLYAADRALFVVAAGMAAWNPLQVAFDPGYQLSIAATAGLIWLSPTVESWCARVPEKWGIRAVVVSTLSAQMAVAPILLYSSGLLSFVALPANILVLAFIPAAMFWSLVAGLAGAFVSALAPLLGLPAYALLSYVLGVTHVLANVPFAAYQLPAFSGAWVFAAYALLILLVRKHGSKTEAAGSRSEPAASGFFE